MEAGERLALVAECEFKDLANVETEGEVVVAVIGLVEVVVVVVLVMVVVDAEKGGSGDADAERREAIEESNIEKRKKGAAVLVFSMVKPDGKAGPIKV